MWFGESYFHLQSSAHRGDMIYGVCNKQLLSVLLGNVHDLWVKIKLVAVRLFILGDDYGISKNSKICCIFISGYHYGIYSCESCKGFFKRTVQNKKTFMCHRKGECEVNITNRKKCPACRFKRCLIAGMKLEGLLVWIHNL